MRCDDATQRYWSRCTHAQMFRNPRQAKVLNQVHSLMHACRCSRGSSPQYPVEIGTDRPTTEQQTGGQNLDATMDCCPAAKGQICRCTAIFRCLLNRRLGRRRRWQRWRWRSIWAQMHYSRSLDSNNVCNAFSIRVRGPPEIARGRGHARTKARKAIT